MAALTELWSNANIQLGAVAVVLLAILNGVIKNAVGKGFAGIAVFFWRKLFRKRVHTLTKEVIAHRIKIRDSLAEQFAELGMKDGMEILITDVLRGGKTYEENKKFLRKYNYQKAYVTDYYDKAMQVIAQSGVVTVKYDATKRKWVECASKDKGAVTAYVMGELDYDHVVALDWVSSKSDNRPTLYYNYRLLQPYERTYFAVRRQVDKRFKASYYELVGPTGAEDYGPAENPDD